MGLRRVRGVRSTLPTNTIIGRLSGGSGKAEMLDLADLARDLNTYGAGSSAGPASGLPAIGDGDILANLSGSTAAPTDHTFTAFLDYVMGSTRGMILRRGAAVWEALALGSNGKVLQSNGTDAAWATIATTGSIATDTDVTLSSLVDKDLLYYRTSDGKWHNVTFSALLDAVLGSTQGSVMYRNATVWTALTPATAGKVLQSNGTGANPSYSTVGAAEWIAAASMATTSALPACTYANGTAGVGATLTGNSNGALPTQDTITPLAGFRLLVKDQADPKQNGLYDVTQVGTVGLPFILTRSLCWDGSAGTVVNDGAVVFVAFGDVNLHSAWAATCTNTLGYPNGYVFGTDSNTWAYVFGKNVLTATSFAGNTDVSLTGLANNDFAQYQTADGKWHNRTPTQATASLDAATATLKGLVPTPPNNTTTFLRGDATFAVPPGTGTVTHTGGALTDHAPLVGAGSDDIKALAAMTNGQVLIGSTGVDPAPAALTAGTGITITNGAGSISIAAPSTGGGGSGFAPLELPLVAHANVTINGASQPVLQANTWSNPGLSSPSMTGYYLSVGVAAASTNNWLIFWDTVNTRGYVLDLQSDGNLVWYSMTNAGNTVLASGTTGGTGRILTTQPTGSVLMACIVAVNAASNNTLSARENWTEVIFPFLTTTYSMASGTWELYVSNFANCTPLHLYQVDLRTNPFMG